MELKQKGDAGSLIVFERREKKMTTSSSVSTAPISSAASKFLTVESYLHHPFLKFQISHCSPSKPDARFLPIRSSHLLNFPAFCKPVAPPRSVSDDTVSVSATNVVEVERVLAVKKKAVEISSELKGTSIFLVGIKSSMKTSLGKLLADVLRYYYFDSGSLVEEACGGEAAARAFKEEDEKGFCDCETEVLKQLSSMGRLVVCAGDGAVQSSTNLALLRHGISIWVDLPVDLVAKEVIEEGGQHPNSEAYDDHVLSQLIVQYNEMKGGYAVSDAVISLQKVASKLGCDDLESVAIEDMAMEVLEEIEKLTRVKKMLEEAARPF